MVFAHSRCWCHDMAGFVLWSNRIQLLTVRLGLDLNCCQGTCSFPSSVEGEELIEFLSNCESSRSFKKRLMG